MNVCLATASSAVDAHSQSASAVLEQVMGSLAVVIGAIGVAAITWGVLCGVFKWVRMEWVTFRRSDTQHLREKLRHHLGYYLLLGLEFLVAADIIETMLSPTLEHLAVLGGIVVIRVIISYSLNWELSLANSDTGSPEC